MALRRLASVAVVAGATLGWPAVCEGASNGTLAFEVVTPVETCDQCGPNGESELFGGGSRIWLAQPDGSNVRPLRCSGTRPACAKLHPAYSPDGRRLAVTGLGGLLILSARGRFVETFERHGSSPAWGPGGQRLAFAASRVLPDQSVTFDVAVEGRSGELRRLYDADYINDIGWSRRGRLAWTTIRYLRGTNGLWVGDPDGRSKVRISRTGRFLSWSPDGSRIAFLTSGALMAIDADGKRRRALTKKCGIGYEDEGGVAWSPEGREIACRSRAGSLVVLNLMTMTLRKVVSWRTFTQGSVGEISWQPVPAR